jgi:hypothetical protein
MSSLPTKFRHVETAESSSGLVSAGELPPSLPSLLIGVKEEDAAADADAGSWVIFMLRYRRKMASCGGNSVCPR